MIPNLYIDNEKTICNNDCMCFGFKRKSTK